MIYIHLLMAILASWRITELFTQDRIMTRLRTRFPTYLWQCPRCMSVWAGAWCALIFSLGSVTQGISYWLNWPFALAWIYLVHLDWHIGKRIAEKGRQLLVEVMPNGNTRFKNELNQQETIQLLQMLVSDQPGIKPNGGQDQKSDVRV